MQRIIKGQNRNKTWTQETSTLGRDVQEQEVVAGIINNRKDDQLAELCQDAHWGKYSHTSSINHSVQEKVNEQHKSKWCMYDHSSLAKALKELPF